MATTVDHQRKPPRQRVPAAERRDALIEAAVHEFAQGGLHGTPVDRIARRVGVAQPYVFSLFASKRELFLAAVERGFERVAETFTRRRRGVRPGDRAARHRRATAMGNAYVELLSSDRDYLMLQLQSYAACDDEVIRDRVRAVLRAAGRHVRAALGRRPGAASTSSSATGCGSTWPRRWACEDLSVGCEWVRAELDDPTAA